MTEPGVHGLAVVDCAWLLLLLQLECPEGGAGEASARFIEVFERKCRKLISAGHSSSVVDWGNPYEARVVPAGAPARFSKRKGISPLISRI